MQIQAMAQQLLRMGFLLLAGVAGVAVLEVCWLCARGGVALLCGKVWV